jgi:hypothetical protein
MCIIETIWKKGGNQSNNCEREKRIAASQASLGYLSDSFMKVNFEK